MVAIDIAMQLISAVINPVLESGEDRNHSLLPEKLASPHQKQTYPGCATAKYSCQHSE